MNCLWVGCLEQMGWFVISIYPTRGVYGHVKYAYSTFGCSETAGLGRKLLRIDLAYSGTFPKVPCYSDKVY